MVDRPESVLQVNYDKNASVTGWGYVRDGVPTVELLIVRDNGARLTVYLDADQLIELVSGAMAEGLGE